MVLHVSTERLFSISCFEGLRLFRTYKAEQPGLEEPKLLDLIKKVDPNGRALDLDAASYLDKLVHPDAPMSGKELYQFCIRVVVIEHQPLWAKTMRAGRQRFLDGLEPDDLSVFAAAGLIDHPPSLEVVRWWDEVAGHARLAIDVAKMEQARQAEALTISYEKERLEALGIEKEPEWPGLDDNFAGYDVLSYDPGDHGPINRLIEVKSTTASPLRFYLTRNEWQQAVKAGDAYHFHAWDMSKDPPVLHELSATQVAPHIPSDNEKGLWTNVEIPISVK